MGRAPCCDKANVKKGPWSPEEDSQLKHYIQTYGTAGNWVSLPQRAGLRRCGKSCRLRWLNYLRPNIKHGEFSPEEDEIICTLFATIGSRWSIIAAQLPGRTDNDIKNYWNTKLKKKLMGIVSNSTNNTIMKKTQSLSPIPHQDASFNHPLSSNIVQNPIPDHPTISYSNTIDGCSLVTNPFETTNQQIQMGFDFGTGLLNYQQMMNSNINDENYYAILDYPNGMLNMDQEEEKKEKDNIIKKEMEAERYYFYY